MKLSLRNLALASAVMVAGAAFAQDAVTPTITKVWGTSVAGPGKNDSRFGTGVNGKVYYNDKANGKVMVIDADGQKEYAAVEGLGTGCTADDAGNLLVNTSFPNAASATNMVLINTDGTQTPVTLAWPEGVEAARVDQIGRVAGNMFSEEGSFFYLGANNVKNVAMFQFAEGKQITPLEYYSSEELAAPTINTSSVVQPEFTFEELVDMGDDAINGFAVRNRSTKNIYYFNPDGDFVAMPAPAGSNTQEGFDVFVLGDVMYQVMPIKGKSGVNYSCEFVIADEAGNIIFTEEVEGAEDGSQSFGSFAARKVSDYKVELYMYYSSGKGIQAAQYDITIPGGDPAFEAPTFYLRGTVNEWKGIEDTYKMVYDEKGANENGEYVFTLTLPALSGEFKFATEDWSTFNYGAKGEDPVVLNGKTLESWTGSSVNFNMGALVLNDVKVTFLYQPDGSKPSYVIVEGTEPAEPKFADRSQFAYNLNVVPGDNYVYSVSFEATGDAASATLVLTEVGTEESAYVELKGDVKKGVNTYEVNLSDYAKTNGKYNYAIEIHNYEIAQDVVTEAQELPAGVVQTNKRGAVVCMTDPTNEFYGYTVIGLPSNGGFDVYNQLGEKVMEAVHKVNDAMGGEKSNNSNPMRGRQRGTTAQFANWGDAAYGVAAFDLAKPDEAPYSVFEGMKEASGKIMNGDIAVGSGTSGLAYAGEGEGTLLFTFDEDIFNNNLAANPIGTAMKTGKAAENWGFGSKMANTNVGLCGTEKGLFFSQVRANGLDPNVYGLAYISLEDKDIIWSAADEAENNPEFLATAAGSVDINPAGDLLAVTTYAGVNVYLLSWDGEMPVLEPYKVITTPYTAAVYSSVRFDAGNNLHVVKQNVGYYQIVLADKEPISVTPGASVLEIVTGVDNVAVDVEAADAVYYNLNGVKVDANNLTPGVYVKVAGKVATKVVVK